MWYLISALKPDERHVFLCKKEYIFGRKDCDVVLSGDPAVSRRHASIHVSHSESNLPFPNKLPMIMLKDLSKFGTWVSGKRVEGEVLLKDGDQIFFGSPKSSFALVYEPFILTTSCLDAPSKKLSRNIVSQVGGHLVNEWRKDCSLLVMNSISVTIKVICALVSQKFIVTPNYLEEFQKYLMKKCDKPDPKNYIPTIIESQITSDDVSFLPDIKRQTIFQSMQFIFLGSKQFKKMNIAIEQAGGMCMLLEEGLDENPISILYDTGSVVMAPTDDINSGNDNIKQWHQQVHKVLKKKKKHTIPDSEIGYAVLYCSTDKHCNPDIPISSQQVIPDIKSQSLSTDIRFESSQILATNTEIAQQGKKKEKTVNTRDGIKIIDETFMAKDIGGKRKSSTTTTSTSHSTVAPSHLSTQIQVPEIKDEPITPDKTENNNNKTSNTAVQQTDIKPESTFTRHRRRSPSPATTSNVTDKTSIDFTIGTPNTPSVVNTSPEVKRVSRRQKSPTTVQTETEVEKPEIPNPIKQSPPDDRRASKRTRSPSPNSAVKRNKVSENESRVKCEIKEEEVSVIEDVDADQIEKNVSSTEIRLADGFLTTRKPLKNQTVKHENYLYESDLPERLMVTSFTELVTRQPSRKNTARGEAVPEGFIKWKGELVKNFKKFKKVRHAGAYILPTIIGGSDLQVHQAERSKELENFFQQSIQAETQLNEQEREAQELFDYKPNHSRKKTR